jgi:hypothetical protein
MFEMTKYYKVTFDLYVPVGREAMSNRLAEETFIRAMEEKFKG